MNRLTPSLIASALLLCSASVKAAVTQADAVRIIIGEAANQGYQGMLGVADVLRRKNSTAGFYGIRNRIVDKQPQWVWRMAEKAWKESAKRDVTHGATHFENVRAFGWPEWARGMTVACVIRDQTFFK